jgi:hypothetical protein
MSNLKIGMRVSAINNGEVKSGVIINIHDMVSTIIVQFDDGTVGKVLTSNVIVEDKQEAVNIKDFEKSEITITPEEFSIISTQVIAKNVDNVIEGLKMARIMSKIHTELFFNSEVDNE